MRQLFLILFLFLLCSFQETKFYRTKINKNISLLLSSDLVPVPPDEIATKFISYRTPLAVYTNMTTEIDFGINTSISRWKESDIELMKSFYKSNISSLYDEVHFLNEEINEINSRQYVVFEYTSKINPEERSAIIEPPVSKYTYIQYTIVKGTVYVFDFSSPADQQEIWHPVIRKIMSSIKIK
jgi:hypothetical protein